ncbi:MAG: nitrogen fixation protein NifX [Zoogloeaceae bacterium]|nr:nitrogen fixation protein NifX [Zoogloeaceae bacterium]
MKPSATLRVAFASDDRQRVNQHFGSARAFVLYDVSPHGAVLSGLGEFPDEAMDGNENKLAAKVEFLAGCDAVFVHAIGASAIRQLLAHGVHPVRACESNAIETLLREIRCAMTEGGVPWIDRALQRAATNPRRFDAMAEEGWE